MILELPPFAANISIEVWDLVTAEKFSPAIRQEARKIGFTGETQRD